MEAVTDVNGPRKRLGLTVACGSPAGPARSPGQPAPTARASPPCVPPG